MAIEPVRINLFFGSNGCGKSSLCSHIHSGATKLPCVVHNDSNTQTYCYDRQFVENNFRANSKVPGIYTIGSGNASILDRIDVKRKELEEINLNENYEKDVKREEEAFEKINKIFLEKCWKVKEEYEGQYKNAMEGSLRSKDDFAKFCLSGYELLKTAEPPDEKIMERNHEAFSKNPTLYDFIEELDAEEYSNIDSAGILKKNIASREESTMGSFFKHLQNSDWVHQGLDYVPHSEGKCPFCTGDLSDEQIQNLKGCFDEEYKKDIEELNEYFDSYSQKTKEILSCRKELCAMGESFESEIDFERFFDKLEADITKNIATIERKVSTPSESLEILPISDKIKTISGAIITLNNKIIEYNEKIADKKNTKSDFTDDLKRVCAKEIKSDVENYITDKNDHEKEIKALDARIDERDAEIEKLSKEIDELSSKVANVTEVVAAINKMLNAFGFSGFELVIDPNDNGYYRIVRENNTDATETLSEGERNFVAFLYFYHFVKGSFSNRSSVESKIVLIDDPITSMDSDVMYIISSLVKDMIKDKDNVEQLFVFTHNLYFFKEISPYYRKRKPSDEIKLLYFILKKRMGVTSIESFEENPIRTSYELIWDEFKNGTPTTIFNSMRRILEQYFRNICGMELGDLPNQYQGEDKIICNALISSLHDGSHCIPDDIMFCIQNYNMDTCKQVFEDIFNKTGQIAHYNKMMNI